MDIGSTIIFIGILVFLAHFFDWLFSFVRIPDVLLLMCIGLLIGPLLNIVPVDFLGEMGNVIVVLTLVIILFEGSIKLKLTSLKEAALGTIGLTFASFLLTMSVVGLVLFEFANFHIISSFLIGAIIGGNAAAIVVPLIEKIKIKESSKTTLFLESGISDVLSIVFTVALIASLEVGFFQINSFLIGTAKTLFISTFIGISAALAWSLLLNKVHNIQNSAFSTPAFVFIIYGIAETMQLSGLIAVIAFGIVLGNIPALISSIREKHKFLHSILHPQPLSTKELSFFREVVFLIKIFFFVFIGISLNFNDLTIIMIGLLLVIIVFAVRVFVVLFSIPRSTLKFDASIMSVTIPRGLAAAVLALIPLQRGIEGGVLVQDIVYSVIFFSILFTSILIFLLHNTGLTKIFEKFFPDFLNNKEE